MTYDSGYEMKKQIIAMATTVEKKTKAIFEPQVKQLKTLIEPKVKLFQGKVEPKVKELMKTKQYNQACALASKGVAFSIVTCKKVIGEERTKSLIQVIEARIPESWKTRPAVPVSPKTVPVSSPA